MRTDIEPRIVGSLYGAYGSNLHIEQMRLRCPGAVRVGAGWLEEHRLVFRTVADVEPTAGSRVPIGLWRLTASDKQALDRYEGVRSGVYERVFRPVCTPSGVEDVLIYRMRSAGYAAPSRSYLGRILEGYAAWEFDTSIVTAAARICAASFA